MVVIFFALAFVFTVSCIAVAVVPLLLALTKARSSNSANRNAEIRAALVSKLAELEAEQAAGIFNAEQAQQLRVEAERSALTELEDQSDPEDFSDKPTPTAILVAISISVIAIPLVAGIVYLQNGEPQSLSDSKVAQATSESTSGAVSQSDIEGMVDSLATKLENGEETNPQAWIMLGRSAILLQRWEQAASSFATARELLGDSADLLVAEANARAMSAGGAIGAEEHQLLDQALVLEPNHPVALWLAGIAAERRGEYEVALDYLQQAKAVITDADSLTNLKSMINDVEQKLGVVTVPTETASQPATELKVQVQVATSLQQTWADNEVLFVFARAIGSEGPPVAVWRGSAAQLPVLITLDDSLAMIPSNNISAQSRVNVVARISASGQATASLGDVFGELLNVELQAVQGTILTLQINEQVL